MYHITATKFKTCQWKLTYYFPNSTHQRICTHSNQNENQVWFAVVHDPQCHLEHEKPYQWNVLLAGSANTQNSFLQLPQMVIIAVELHRVLWMTGTTVILKTAQIPAESLGQCRGRCNVRGKLTTSLSNRGSAQQKGLPVGLEGYSQSWIVACENKFKHEDPWQRRLILDFTFFNSLVQWLPNLSLLFLETKGFFLNDLHLRQPLGDAESGAPKMPL